MHASWRCNRHVSYLHCHVKFLTVVCICIHAYMSLLGVQRVNSNKYMKLVHMAMSRIIIKLVLPSLRSAAFTLWKKRINKPITQWCDEHERIILCITMPSSGDRKLPLHRQIFVKRCKIQVDTPHWMSKHLSTMSAIPIKVFLYAKLRTFVA